MPVKPMALQKTSTPQTLREIVAQFFRSYTRRQGITALTLFAVALVLMLLASCSSGPSDASGSSTKDATSAQSDTTSATPSKSPDNPASDAAAEASAAPATVTATASSSSQPQKSDKDTGHASTSGGGNHQNEKPQPTTSVAPSYSQPPAKADIALSSSTCDISDNGVLYIVKAQGWEDGPYTTHAAYRSSASDAYATYDNIDYPDNPASDASPADHWQWPCSNDPPGHYKLWFTEMGSSVAKSEFVYFDVVT